MTDSCEKQASHAHARAAFTLRISIARVPQKFNSAGQAAAAPVPVLSDPTTKREIWAISSGPQILYCLYYHRIRDIACCITNQDVLPAPYG
jgi:hypothetical protein